MTAAAPLAGSHQTPQSTSVPPLPVGYEDSIWMPTSAAVAQYVSPAALATAEPSLHGRKCQAERWTQKVGRTGLLAHDCARL